MSHPRPGKFVGGVPLAEGMAERQVCGGCLRIVASVLASTGRIPIYPTRRTPVQWQEGSRGFGDLVIPAVDVVAARSAFASARRARANGRRRARP
ncbi:hypothetical protein GCM10023332_11800 [Luteimonas vadosa]|uniref:Uncharacterized protein n=1 Tax=Luteimonas vadosa TaxID=1165507 RepID=A0ABP9DVQ8_9GAMM